MLNYQNAMYNAANTPHIITDDIINDVLTLNILRSTSMPLSFSLGDANDIATINTMQITNTHIIRFKNGIGASKCPEISGRNLKATDSGIVNSPAVKAALEVVLFQKRPRQKMASTPGDIKPTYSCINW